MNTSRTLTLPSDPVAATRLLLQALHDTADNAPAVSHGMRRVLAAVVVSTDGLLGRLDFQVEREAAVRLDDAALAVRDMRVRMDRSTPGCAEGAP